MSPTAPPSPWTTAHEAHAAFCARHPELGLQPTFFGLHNLLRRFRAPLEAADALRKAGGRHWIAHRERYPQVMFDLLTTRFDERAAS